MKVAIASFEAGLVVKLHVPLFNCRPMFQLFGDVEKIDPKVKYNPNSLAC